jgi:hypothetical protein
MEKETITRIKLTASDGMVLTDGEHFGKEVFLAEGADVNAWYEITEAEAEAIQKEREEMASQETY